MIRLWLEACVASRGLVHTNGVCPEDIGASRMEIGKFGDIEDFGVNNNPLVRGAGSATGIKYEASTYHVIFFVML